MSVPVCPKDYLVVELDKKFMDQTGTGLFVDTTFRPGYHATVTGKVLSTPLGLSSHPQKKVIVPEVQVGDDIAFAYSVVYNQDTTDNAQDIFYQDPVMNPWETRWTNGAGMQLLRRNKGGGKFDAAYFRVVAGQKAEVIDKISGTQAEVNNWVDKYMVDRNHFIQHRNNIWEGDKEFWRVDYPLAYMVRRNGEFKMIGGYVLLENQDIEQKTYSGNIELWGEKMNETKKEVKSKVVCIGTPLRNQRGLRINKGDEVVVNAMTAQQYNFWGNDYILVRQDQILAKA